MKHENFERNKREALALLEWARKPIKTEEKSISEDTDAWIRAVSKENAAQAVEDERCVPVIPCEDEPAHTENNGYWCDDPSCPCRQERSYCERYVKVEVS